MLQNLKSIADWFIKAGKNNQVIIMFFAITAILAYDRVTHLKKIADLERRQFRADSINVNRFNTTVASFQKKIEDCNNERIKAYIKQSEAYQKKYEEVFKKSDEYYQELQKLKQQLQ